MQCHMHTHFLYAKGTLDTHSYPLFLLKIAIIWMIYSFLAMETDDQLPMEECEFKSLQCLGGGLGREKLSAAGHVDASPLVHFVL